MCTRAGVHNGELQHVESQQTEENTLFDSKMACKTEYIAGWLASVFFKYISSSIALNYS